MLAQESPIPANAFKSWPEVLASLKSSLRRRPWRPRVPPPKNVATRESPLCCHLQSPDRPDPPGASDLSAKGLLRAINYEVGDNRVASHCWWHASSCHTGLPMEAAMLQVWKCSSARGLLSTSVDEITLAVSGLHRLYRQGLLFLHEPGSCAYYFQAQRRPSCISLFSVQMLLLQKPRVPLMLFMQECGVSVGHYAACVLRAAALVTEALPRALVCQALPRGAGSLVPGHLCGGAASAPDSIAPAQLTASHPVHSQLSRNGNRGCSAAF